MTSSPLRRVSLLLVLLGMAHLQSSEVAAQPPGDPSFPPFLADSEQMKPGTWVRLAIRRAGGPTMDIKMSALKKQGQGQWFEFAYRDPNRPPMVLKTLMEGTLSQPKRTTQALLQLGKQPPIAFPSKLVGNRIPVFTGAKGRATQAAKGAGGARVVGKEQVKVAAGTYSAVHYQRKLEGGGVEHYWISQQVPGWPLVKLTRPGLTVELLGHGKSARSEISGEPIKLAPSLFKHLDAFK